MTVSELKKKLDEMDNNLEIVTPHYGAGIYVTPTITQTTIDNSFGQEPEVEAVIIG